MIKLEDITERQFERCRQLVYQMIERQTESLPVEKVESTAKQTYQLMGEEFPAPDKVFQAKNSSSLSSLRSNLDSSLSSSLRSSLGSSLRSSLRSSLYSSLRSNLDSGLSSSLYSSLYCGISWRFYVLYFTLGEELGASFEHSKFTPFNAYQRYCSIGIWNKLIYIGFPNPHKVSLVEVGTTKEPFCLPTFELHSDGSPSWELLDLKDYHWHNTQMPEKYGSVHSSRWQPEWFVTEENVEIKRILAEQIGYDRLFQALNAKQIDTWREYRLWRAENVDVEPMHILEMKCPSTNKIHYGRVPPDCMFARDAAALRNHGIDPEDFIIEH